MQNPSNEIKALNQEELAQLEKEHPNTTIIPISEKQIEEHKEHALEVSALEKEFPILKTTQESVQLFGHQMDMENGWMRYIEKLEYTPIKVAIEGWLNNLSSGTKRNYAYYISDMMKKGIIPELDGGGNVFTVGHFNHVPHEKMIDFIKKMDCWSEGTRQVRAACYISLTSHLERISRGWFRKAQPSTLASNPTFFAVRDKCATKALSLIEWHRFIDALHSISKRDSIIARCMLQGAKRISEVLELTLEQVEFDKNIIRFRQKKTGGMLKEIPITYPQHFMDELKEYFDDTLSFRKPSSDPKESPYIFITRTGKRLTRSRFNYSFNQAAKDAKIKKVTPHMLRTTWVTEAINKGADIVQMMKVTGHSSPKMIYAYDKNSLEDNYSKKLVLI